MATASAPVKALPEALPKGKTEETVIKEIQDELRKGNYRSGQTVHC